MSDSGKQPGIANAGRLMADLETLARFGANAEGGIDRPAYSPAYRQAADWLAARMREAGLAVREDSAGNLIGRMGPAGPALLCGSHIDTVPNGGRYDGALGVLAALEVARTLAAEPMPLRHGFEVVAFMDEEGSHLGLMGSRALAGTIELPEIEAAVGRGGDPLPEAMRAYGLVPERIKEAARPPGELAGYLELHIEQGPRLEAAGLAIGVVEGIVGIDTTEHRLTGMANHSGTTPMASRRDAMRVAAEAMTACFARFPEAVPDTTLNFGKIAVRPGASSIVAGEVTLTQEVRALDQANIDAFAEVCRQQVVRIAEAHGVGCATRRVTLDRPARCAREVQERIVRAAETLGLAYRSMPSGASHDAATMATVCPTGMLFVPSRHGISHSPLEHTDPEAIARGLEVLHETCRAWLGGGT